MFTAKLNKVCGVLVDKINVREPFLSYMMEDSAAFTGCHKNDIQNVRTLVLLIFTYISN